MEAHRQHRPDTRIEWASLMTIHDEFEARYWSRTLGLSRSEVLALFGTLGGDRHRPEQDEDLPPSIAPLLKRQDLQSVQDVDADR